MLCYVKYPCFVFKQGITYDTGGADVKAGGHMAGMHRYVILRMYINVVHASEYPFVPTHTYSYERNG